MRITNRATYLAQSEGILSELGIVPDQNEVLRFPDPAHTKDMLASLTPKVTFEKLLPVYGYVFIKYGPAILKPCMQRLYEAAKPLFLQRQKGDQGLDGNFQGLQQGWLWAS